MSNALVTMPTVATDDGIEADHHNNVAANIRSLSRNFWDAGTPDLALSEQKQGTSWVDPTTLAMWIFRIDGAGDPRDAGSPLRPTWHWNDFEGAPPDDARVAEGDCLIWDSGSGDTYVLHRDAGRFRGYGVLAEYRTAATALSTTQNSDAVAWRSSRWVTSAAKYRQWRILARADASDANNSFLSVYHGREEGSEYRLFDFEHKQGSISKFFVFGDGAGSTPAIGFTADPAGVSPGSISCVFGPNGTDIDGTAVWFKHGDSTRHVRWRYFGVDDETTGVGAEVLAVTYQQAATVGEPTKASPSLVHRGAAWDGAASVELATYSQFVPTSDTEGYIRRGFDFGVGVLDFYSDGGVRITQDPAGSSGPAGQLQLNTTVAATSGAKTSPGGAFSSIGYSWDGAASQPRVMGWYTNVDDPADAGDVWSHRLIAVGGGSPTDVLFATSQGWLGIGATPAVAGHITETTTITGGVTDGYTAGLRIQPTYTAATAQTVTRHNYLDAKNPTLSGAGPAALTDACLVRFDAAAGTHKAVDASSTKTTPGGVDAWVKVNINGTIHYMPAYLSKTA